MRLLIGTRKEAVGLLKDFWTSLIEQSIRSAEIRSNIPQVTSARAEWSSRCFPFVIVFRQAAPGVEIIAVAHGRRRPGYCGSASDKACAFL
jgi:hypothetical protein